MGLHEWSWGGVYFSPLLSYALVALVLTFVVHWLMQATGMMRWVWHDALFECALFVLILVAITWSQSGSPGI